MKKTTNILTYIIENEKLKPIIIQETVETIRQNIEDGIPFPLISIQGVDSDISSEIVEKALSNGLLRAKDVTEYKNILIKAANTNLPILIQKIIESVDNYIIEHGSLFPIPFDVIQ